MENDCRASAAMALGWLLVLSGPLSPCMAGTAYLTITSDVFSNPEQSSYTNSYDTNAPAQQVMEDLAPLTDISVDEMVLIDKTRGIPYQSCYMLPREERLLGAGSALHYCNLDESCSFSDYFYLTRKFESNVHFAGTSPAGIDYRYSTRSGFTGRILARTNGAIAITGENRWNQNYADIMVFGNPASGGSCNASLKLGIESKSGPNYIKEITGNNHAFTARFTDGTVLSWGSPATGGEGPGQALQGVRKVFSNPRAFAALLEDGSIAAWGDPDAGGALSSAVQDVVEVYHNKFAFAAVTGPDRRVVAWGHPRFGGSLGGSLAHVAKIFPAGQGFVAVTEDRDDCNGASFYGCSEMYAWGTFGVQGADPSLRLVTYTVGATPFYRDCQKLNS